MKVALVYDRVNRWGGAERVLLALHELFPDAPLYTSVYNKKNSPWADAFEVKTSFLQNIPFAVENHELFALLMPLAFESFSFDSYDLVISVTSESAKGIITPHRTKHICYCLTPTRYLWSGYENYFPGKAVRSLAHPAISYLRKWDKLAAHRPDHMVAISEEVEKRITKYYGRKSSVIYPPRTLSVPEEKKKIKKKKEGDYFFIVSRLSKFTQYKRIDLAIAACNALQLPLKIAGDGSWKKDLEKQAGPTIEFLGNVTDAELAEYYAGAKALIFPGVEDFGLTIVEAQQFGKPVIAYRAGGALETIKEGKTGYFFDEQSKESLIHALQTFDAYSFDPNDAREQSEQFSKSVFAKNFLSLVNTVV